MADDLISRYLGITDPNQQSALRQGILRAGLGMLANASQPYGASPLRAIGIGGLEGVAGYNDALTQQQQQSEADLRRGMLLLQQQQAQRRDEGKARLRDALAQGDRARISSALADVDPAAAGKLALAPPKGQPNQTLLDALNNPQSPFYEAARAKYLGIKPPEAQAQDIARSSAGAPQIPITIAENSMARGWGSVQAKDAGAIDTAARTSRANIALLDEQDKLLDRGVIAGDIGGIKTTLQRGLSFAGLNTPEAEDILANSSSYDANVARLAVGLTRQMTGPQSEKELALAMLSSGKRDTIKQGLKLITKGLRARAMADIRTSRQMRERIKEAGLPVFTPDPGEGLPVDAAPADAAPTDLNAAERERLRKKYELP